MLKNWRLYGTETNGGGQIKIGDIGIRISSLGSRTYNDGTRTFKVYLSITNADSKELITVKKVRGFRSDAIKAAEEWIECSLKAPLIELEYERSVSERLSRAEEEARNRGAILDIDKEDFDDEHKDSFWYGGTLAELSYRGYSVIIRAVGEVRVSVYNDEEHYESILDYVDKNNSGALQNIEAVAIIKNDKHLRELERLGLLYWGNNNWIEFFIYDDDGNGYDVTEKIVGGFMGNIYEGDVIDAITDVEYFTSAIDEYLIRCNGGITIQRDGGKRITLTAEEVEQVYREKELQYRVEDACKHVYEFFGEEAFEYCSDEEKCAKEKYGVFPSELLRDRDIRDLAQRFIDKHDCNMDENTLWNNIIEQYIKEGR